MKAFIFDSFRLLRGKKNLEAEKETSGKKMKMKMKMMMDRNCHRGSADKKTPYWVEQRCCTQVAIR